MDELLTQLITQIPVVAAFIFFALEMRKSEDKRAKSSEKILGDVLKQDSTRDEEWRAYLTSLRLEQKEQEDRRDLEQRDREKQWQQFLHEEREKHNATLSDNTTVMHKAMVMFEKISTLLEDLNR